MADGAAYDAMEKLARRSEKAWGVADAHHTTLREAYRWMMPDRYAKMNSQSQQQNRNSYDHIFDPTGQQSLDDGASQIAEALHPWDQIWARWVARMDVPEEDRATVEHAGKVFTETCATMLNRSNFDGAAVASHKDFLLGTGFLMIDRDEWDPQRVRFTACPAYQWAIEADNSGRIQAMFRKMTIRARDAETMLPQGLWSPAAMKLVKDAPDTDIALELAIYREHKSGMWRTCYYECAEKHEVLSKLSRTSPLLVYRSGLVAGDAWGSGPGLKALPDVKVANKVVELILKNAAIAVVGIWQAEDDGVLNPNTIRLTPGTVIPIAQGSKGLTPLGSPGDFNVAELVLNTLQVNIRRAFYVMRIEEREMTAEEYRGRLQQQMREQRGVYGQLKSEFAEQLYLRLIDLGVEMGLIQDSYFDQMAQIELTGPLAMDVRGAAVDQVKQAVMDLQTMLGPEVAYAVLKVDDLAPWVAQQRHARPEAFREGAELKQLGQQVLQMAAQQQAAAAAAGVAP